MFWKYNSPSSVQIDNLLQQENVCLQKLMDEDELLQECKAQNKKVIEYLTQPQTLEELVSYLVTDPSPDKELQVRFKYANLASELLTCDVPLIVDKVASSSNLLHMLYQFLEKEKPLNPLLASFVSKVFGMLVQRRSEQNWYSYQFTCFQVLEFLKSQGDFVEVAVKHIGTSAVMDLLCKLICGVDDDDQEIKQGIHQWLNECHLIEQLIEKLSPDCDSEEHFSVDQLLCEIVNSGQDSSVNGSEHQSNGSQSSLLTTLESKDVVNKLMDILLHEERNESSVSHIINILLTLLSHKGSHKQSNLHHTNSVEIINSNLDSRTSVLETIVGRLPDLQKILIQPTKLGTLMSAYGVEVERLGSTRLKVVSLISALIASRDYHVHMQMASLCTLQLLFDLFFKFSLNNFLHTQVTQCVMAILSQDLCNLDCEGKTQEMDGLNNNPLKLENGKSIKEEEKEYDKSEEVKEESQKSEVTGLKHPLLLQLFNKCNIIQKILDCYAAEEENSSSEKKLHNMIGYMGHIREIANTIVQSSKEGPCAELITQEMKKLPNDVITQWEEFTLIGLAEVNLKNKIIPLQGFKEGDMDSIGDMRFVEDFKDAEETLNGSSHRLPGQLGSGPASQEMNVDDEVENSLEKFEEMCSERSSDDINFAEIWKGKERIITFGDLQKPEDDEAHHSSSEEGDIDDEFDSLRASDDKMEVEFASEEWSEVFDKRGNALSMESNFNPWQSAPASETADNNSWADFGASPFVTSSDPFVQSDSQNTTSFVAFSTSNSGPVSQPSGFQADFSNVFFSSPSPESSSGTQVAFQADFSQPIPLTQFKEESFVAQSDPNSSRPESFQNICDANKPVPNAPGNFSLNEDMSCLETSENVLKEAKELLSDPSLPINENESISSPSPSESTLPEGNVETSVMAEPTSDSPDQCMTSHLPRDSEVKEESEECPGISVEESSSVSQEATSKQNM